MTPDPATPDPATPDPATPDPDPSAHVPAPLVGTADPDLTLTELLAVTPTDEPDMFVGLTETYGQLGIYGGHFLGQALAAAFMTVEEPKLAQSFHAHFLARGNPDAELTYRVDRLRSGHRRDIRAVTRVAGWHRGVSSCGDIQTSRGRRRTRPDCSDRAKRRPGGC